MIELVQAEVIAWLGAFIKRLQAGDAQLFHAVFSDPPYFLGSIVKRFGKKNAKPAKQEYGNGGYARMSKGFMGQSWDGFESPQAFQDWCEQWGGLLIQACYPGAVGIFYGGTRTVHRLECGLENAGWEIFDRGLYLYGSGMPHSHNVGLSLDKQGHENAAEWDGYGTLLKPAYEPIVFARAPRGKYTFAQCAMQFGTGALNIDGCRIATDETITNHSRTAESGKSKGIYGDYSAKDTFQTEGQKLGRWPANVVFDDSAAELLDEMTGIHPTGGRITNRTNTSSWFSDSYNDNNAGYGDTGGASRFFYSSKAPQWEREAGLDQFPLQDGSIGDRRPSGSYTQRIHKDRNPGEILRRNVHPTVKPLLQSIYWATLLLPPALEVWRERRLLVPFAGTGSEAIGARFAGWDSITAVEMGADYYAIARARVAYWNGFDSYEQAKPAEQPEADFNDEKPLKKKPKKKRAPKTPALTQLSFLED